MAFCLLLSFSLSAQVAFVQDTLIERPGGVVEMFPVFGYIQTDSSMVMFHGDGYARMSEDSVSFKMPFVDGPTQLLTAPVTAHGWMYNEASGNAARPEWKGVYVWRTANGPVYLVDGKHSRSFVWKGDGLSLNLFTENPAFLRVITKK